MNSYLNIKNEDKKNLLKTIFILFFIISIIFLTGCYSTDKKNSYIGTGSNLTYSCSYDAEENKTHITWKSYIQNDTIYSINKIRVQFDYFYIDTKIETKELEYNISVKHGTTQDINCQFYAEGQINKIVYLSWQADYLNIWNTYHPWWITTIVVVSILWLVYIILMILLDLDLDDVFEFISEHFFVTSFIILPFSVIVPLSIYSSNWIPTFIILGGIVVFIILGLVAHLVKYIIEEISFASTPSNPNWENVKNYINDEEKLALFSVSDLKDYCRNNNIKGFSSLNKEGLVALICNKNNTNEREKKEKISFNQKSIEKKEKITFDSIAGLEKAKQIFKEKVVLPFEHPELFEKFGKKAGGGILLYGLPGTGKTMFAEAASNELNATFIPIKCSDIKSKWYGESEQNVKSIFDKAKKSERAIIFFDEFEAIGAKRTDDRWNVNNDLVPAILTEMQGVGSSSIKSTIMIIAATNKPWAIDSAFMRPGRFDEKIYIPLPDFKTRKSLFRIQLKNLPLAEDLDFDYLAKITDGFNGVDSKEVCEKLKMSAIKDSLTKGKEQTIGMDDVKKIEHNIKSSVSQDDIEQLRLFEQNLK